MSFTKARLILQDPRRHFQLNRQALSLGLEFLDEVDLHVVFRTRALVVKNVLLSMKGASQCDPLRMERDWET